MLKKKKEVRKSKYSRKKQRVQITRARELVSHEEVKIPLIVNQRGDKCGADSYRRFHKKRQETGGIYAGRASQQADRKRTESV
jgi:hypothetical protein